MKKGLSIVFSLLLVLSLALMGCSGSKETGKEKGGEKKEKTAESGGTMIYARGGDAVKLDPITVTDGESLIVTHQILETLVKYEKETADIVPGLAKDWEVSDDGTTYTFELEEGVKFHDGTDFNADAVVKNFERWMNGKDEAEFPYFVSQFGGFKGEEAAVIKEVKAVDENKVEFTLFRPQAPFLKNLAMTPFGISSPAAIEKFGDKYIENPVGTGPFKFESWKRNDTITVVKNEDYWKEGLPKLDKVIFKVITDNSARLNALIKGEVDLIDGLNPSDVEKVKADSNLQIFERPSMNIGYLGFNVEKEPFDNKKVRQAISHAINKQAIIDNFYEGTAEPAKNPIPPSINGYNDEIEDYEFDLDKAKKLLEEAGFKDGFKMDLWAMPVPRPYMPNGQKVAEAIQADLEKLNIEVNIVSMEWGTYLEKVRDGEAPMFMLGWTGDNGDADNFLYALLDKDSIGSNNYSRYASEDVHKLLIEAQTETDEDKRSELYKEALEIIHDDAPWVPLAHSVPQLAGKSTIDGFFPHPTGSQAFDDVSME
ncbi:ABC transporter substrate-binding protein [Siminovitchia fortis]|uniref:ABC transporter substrate-binding protein n=1 Tax=Siminovitchia fortis TaxID=254758 RepID=A0A443IK60_9BACI|nr:ABC transporter substrate-binding protein [Siminovitchia fortis]RWR05037.1 ABC transporter substrate-binding protein [Siminovitchia fortis]WHY81988.1 ABC transporter substrate-binding protein [Siminovitchia fortis]